MNGIVYVAGGWTLDAVGYVHVTAAFEGYDPVSNTWNASLPRMPTARARVGVAALGGIVYAVGGSNVAQSANALATVESYNTASGTWSENHTPMPTARYDVGVGAINGILYVVGGGSPPHSYYGSLDAYNPATNTWDTSLPPLPTVRHTGAAVAVVNGVLYVVGGSTASGEQLATLEGFDPSKGNWSTALPPMPTARTVPGAAVLDDVMYVVGGCNCHNCGCVQNIVQAFDPKVGNWSDSKFPNEPTQRLTNAIAASGSFIITTAGMAPDGLTMLKSTDAFGLDVICQANWSAPNCTDCDGKHFGAECNQTVTCMHGTASSGTDGNGHCSSCIPRWAGQDCDDCDATHFGSTCSRNVTCRHGNASHGLNGTGHCLIRCDEGWAGQDCDDCDASHFGAGCRAVTCRHGNASSGINGTGHCTGSCFDRWTGPDCDKCAANWDPHQDCNDCDSRHYGPTCSTNCSSCEQHSMVCHPGTNGSCTTPPPTPTPAPTHRTAPVAVIVGATTGVVLLAIGALRLVQPALCIDRPAATGTHVDTSDTLQLVEPDADQNDNPTTTALRSTHVYE